MWSVLSRFLIEIIETKIKVFKRRKRFYCLDYDRITTGQQMASKTLVSKRIKPFVH